MSNLDTHSSKSASSLLPIHFLQFAWIFCLGLSLIFKPAQADQPIDQVLAIVDDGVVLQSELDQRIETIMKQINQQGQTPPTHRIIKDQIMERLILESIQHQMAERMGIRISDNEINDAIQRIADSKNLSLFQLKTELEQSGIQYADFRSQIRTEMKLERVQRQQLSRRIQVNQQDVKQFLQTPLGKDQFAFEYHLSHILLSAPFNASPEAMKTLGAQAHQIHKQITEETTSFAAMARTHSSAPDALEGGNLGWRQANAIPSTFTHQVLGMKAGEVSKPIRSSYGFHLVQVKDIRSPITKLEPQTQVRHILIKPNEIRSHENAKLLILDLHQRLIQGADFTELAQAFSDDPGSARSGGDLGWVTSGKMVAPFEQVMNQTEAGDISKPFETQFGWHVLNVTQRRTKDVGIEFQTDQAKQVIFRKKYEEALQSWLQEIRQNAYVDIKTKDYNPKDAAS